MKPQHKKMEEQTKRKSRRRKEIILEQRLLK